MLIMHQRLAEQMGKMPMHIVDEHYARKALDPKLVGILNESHG